MSLREQQKITEMGKLAQMAYKSPNQDNFKIDAILSDFIDDDNGIKYKLNSEYRVIDYVDKRTDMQALLLERGETNGNGEFKGSGNYVLAFRGTESRVDIEVDAIIGLGNINIQYSYALEFTYKALAKIAKDKNCSIEEAKSYLTLTGHSLGGIL